MSLILSLETATTNCSVALSNDGKIVAVRSINDGFSHSEKINIFIVEVLGQANKTINQLEAVAVSIGPGSYTGLRIGVSTAKGLCYGLGIPLIAVNTLDAMAEGIAATPDELIIPMIDARRMEAYCAVYTSDKKNMAAAEAVIIDEQFYLRFRENNNLVLAGDGADKCIPLFQNENSIRILSSFVPKAEYVSIVANRKFHRQEFENVSLIEPFYLKEYLAGKKKE